MNGLKKAAGRQWKAKQLIFAPSSSQSESDHMRALSFLLAVWSDKLCRLRHSRDLPMIGGMHERALYGARCECVPPCTVPSTVGSDRVQEPLSGPNGPPLPKGEARAARRCTHVRLGRMGLPKVSVPSGDYIDIAQDPSPALTGHLSPRGEAR